MTASTEKIDLSERKIDLLPRAHGLVLALYKSLDGQAGHGNLGHSIKELSAMQINNKKGAQEFCKFVRKNFQNKQEMASLFLYQGQQIDPSRIDEFRKSSPLGLCQETFDRYTEYNESKGLEKVTEEGFKHYLERELTNSEISKFKGWRQYLQLPETYNGKSIDQNIQRVITYMTNNQGKKLVQLLIQFEPSPLASILINVFFPEKVYINENFDGNKYINLLTLWLKNINSLDKEVIDNFSNNVTSISEEKKTLLDNIFVWNNLIITDSTTSVAHEKMIDFVKFVGESNKDLLQVMVNAIYTGQITYQQIRNMNLAELQAMVS